MKPETANLLRLAVRALVLARQLYALGFKRPAAREAYYAVLHASRAYIFEKKMEFPRTHAGAHRRFSELAMQAGDVPVDMLRLPAMAYEHKTWGDYGQGRLPDAHTIEPLINATGALLAHVCGQVDAAMPDLILEAEKDLQT